MKNTYSTPVVQVLDLVNEDVLTTSLLSIKHKNAQMDSCDWYGIFGART